MEETNEAPYNGTKNQGTRIIAFDSNICNMEMENHLTNYVNKSPFLIPALVFVATTAYSYSYTF